MDANLLEKEVLCLIDTRAIQKFLFHTNSAEESIGAENLLNSLPYDSVQYAVTHIDPPLKPDEYIPYHPGDDVSMAFDDNPHVKVQVVECVATNLVILFRTGRLYRDVVRKMARYYLDNGYSLQFASVFTERTENLLADISAAYKKMGECKSNFPGAHPLEPLSIARIEKNTGEPIAYVDTATGHEYSRVSLLRRKHYTGTGNLQNDTQGLRRTSADGKKYYSVAHFDGNNMGALIMTLTTGEPGELDFLQMRRKISNNIYKTTGQALDAAKTDVKASFHFTDAQLERAVRVAQRGGDDLNIIADPLVVFSFAESYLRHLSDIPIWDDGKTRVCISACSGIAFVEEHVSYIKAFDYAEECCARAKDVAKDERNLIDGAVGNWLDYSIIYPDMLDDSETDRDTVYAAADGTRLLMRPYCIDAAFRDTPYSYGRFQDRVGALAKTNLLHRTVSDLKLVCGMNADEMRLYCHQLTIGGRAAADLLGQPLERYRDRAYAAWYDALELYDFLRSMEGEGK